MKVDYTGAKVDAKANFTSAKLALHALKCHSKVTLDRVDQLIRGPIKEKDRFLRAFFSFVSYEAYNFLFVAHFF